MCKCCSSYEYWKDNIQDKDKFKEKVFAKLSIYTWRKNQRATKGKQISTITSRAYNLNYCPTCGRKLVK